MRIRMRRRGYEATIRRGGEGYKAIMRRAMHLVSRMGNRGGMGGCVLYLNEQTMR